ncbi:Mut7-C RNAse domain-containing protein [Tenuifilum thalassicum]|uniref:Mut7-C RNAse domain-containing protein n=1 Tax=Tenuifilum thalassicum TaxID=2590900 RepID=UPI0015634520|nr:Mut7-C RNAse domain-containing protein [Tenuifilum thalassicum]
MSKGFKKQVSIRLYGSLNDFVAQELKQTNISVGFWGNPTIKDLVESVGVPHTEINLILANSCPVNFSYKPESGSRISCYPKFFFLKNSESCLQPQVPMPPKFICDAHLGRLASYIRLCGFDTLFNTTFEDRTIIKTSNSEERIILTRDKGLLRCGSARLGYFVRETKPILQLREVIEYFELKDYLAPFSRCSLCNGKITDIEKKEVVNKVLPTTYRCYEKFYCCTKCGHVYWEGSHFRRLKLTLEGML